MTRTHQQIEADRVDMELARLANSAEILSVAVKYKGDKDHANKLTSLIRQARSYARALMSEQDRKASPF